MPTEALEHSLYGLLELNLVLMPMIYDIWVRAVVESEAAANVNGFRSKVFSNIQFIQTTNRNPNKFSDSQWRKILEKLFDKQGVRVPEQGLERKQKVSVACKQLEGEQFSGEVEIPEEYIGENPNHSVQNIY
jgi:hypothetical protein